MGPGVPVGDRFPPRRVLDQLDDPEVLHGSSPSFRPTETRFAVPADRYCGIGPGSTGSDDSGGRRAGGRSEPLMALTLTWLDYAERDRRRALDVIDLFRETGTVDELGLWCPRRSPPWSATTWSTASSRASTPRSGTRPRNASGGGRCCGSRTRTSGSPGCRCSGSCTRVRASSVWETPRSLRRARVRWTSPWPALGQDSKPLSPDSRSRISTPRARTRAGTGPPRSCSISRATESRPEAGSATRTLRASGPARRRTTTRARGGPNTSRRRRSSSTQGSTQHCRAPWLSDDPPRISPRRWP